MAANKARLHQTPGSFGSEGEDQCFQRLNGGSKVEGQTVSERNEDLDSAAKYRRRAQELRRIAESIDDEKALKTVLEIADDYEKLARSRELIDTIGRRPFGR